MCNPSYIKLYKESKLEDRIRKAEDIISSCQLCPQKCGVDRTVGQKGICKMIAE